MQTDASSWFEQASKDIDATQRDVLTLLALSGPANITGLKDLANASGLRETPTRQLSTLSLRPHVDALLEAGLAHVERDKFSVRREAKYPALRDAAERQRLGTLALAVTAELYSPRYYGGQRFEAEKTIFELDVALARGGSDVDRALDHALGSATQLSEWPELVVGMRSVFPALAHGFDRAWFEHLPEQSRARLLWLTVQYAEVSGEPLGDLYAYLLARRALFTPDPSLHTALFGAAVLAGDLEGAEALTLAAVGDTRALLDAALAVARGTFNEDIVFVLPKKHEPIGVARLLQGLSLIARGGAEDIAKAKRIASAGARKGAGFRRSAGWLKEMIELALSGSNDSLKRALDSREESDCLEALLRGTFAIWADASLAAEMAQGPCSLFANSFSAKGQLWLATQYQACTSRIDKMLARPSKAALLANRVGRPLYELRTEKERWELSLEAIERIAATSGVGQAATPQSEERISWRVSPRNLDIEPYLQTRKGEGFTRGRKLAIKHLLTGEAQLKRLPPEDRAVAEHARERREVSYGYPQIFHYFEPQAWLALVGHPRVALAETDEPVEVARGAVHIVAQSERDAFVVKLIPADLRHELEVRQEGARLFVYSITAQALPLLGVLGSGLTLPAAARDRALASLGRLAHLVPVQTSERGSARVVPADPRTWLRIVPRGTGLSVSASVRPLGASGPQLVPGEGTPHLLGHQASEPVQTERDLGAERAQLVAFLAQCPLLEELGVEGDAVLLEDPAACLELLSVLQHADCQVAVEWPEGKPFKLRARVGRKALRARVQLGAAYFFAAGSLEIDSELSLELSELLALVSDSPGKFARLASGDFIELERDLRDQLELLSAARVDTATASGGVSLSRGAFAALEQLSADGSGFELDSGAAEYRTRLLSAFGRTPRLPRGLEAELRDYQLDGFRWLSRLADAELSGCLADDMGLGKTLQAIALLLQRAKQGPALVVAPTSVCDNWRREIARFAPSLEVCYFSGPDREKELGKLGPRSVVITSYALLQQDAARLQAISFATAILDEAQLIKNSESQRAKAACGLDAKVRFALTGTPVENHVGDLYSIFRFLLPDLVGTWPAFSRRFGASRTGEAAAQARRSLKRLLKPYLLRRTKAQVLDELPPLTEIEHRVTLGPAEVALYEGIRLKALSALAEGAADPRARLRVLAEITRLRRLCCHPQLVSPSAPDQSSKLDALVELIAELREGHHRALIFSQFVDVLSRVRERLDAQGVSYQYLDGSTAAPRRSAAVDAFQAGESDLFLISLKAGGFGLNLTGADYVIHVDPWWNPAVEAQASDRAHRIGQTRPVTVYRLIAGGTIEERIVELHRKKRELADSLLDESHTAATLGPDELRALLEE